jgi:uncharacterized protein YlaI
MPDPLIDYLVVKCRICKKEKKISREEYKSQSEIQQELGLKTRSYICQECTNELEDSDPIILEE